MAWDGSDIPDAGCVRKLGPGVCWFGIPKVVRCSMGGFPSFLNEPALCFSFTHRQTTILATGDYFVAKRAYASLCQALPKVPPLSFACSAFFGQVIKMTGEAAQEALRQNLCLGVRLPLFPRSSIIYSGQKQLRVVECVQARPIAELVRRYLY